MDGKGDVEGADLSHVESYRALQKILTRTNSVAKEDDDIWREEAQKAIVELEELLNSKFTRGLLNTGEVKLRSALLTLRCSVSSSTNAVEAYQRAIQGHLEMTFNCNGSAVNVTAFLLYISFLLNHYYSHSQMQPVENELTLPDLRLSEGSQDIIKEWTGLKGGILIDKEGRYQIQSTKIDTSDPTSKEGWNQLLSTASIRLQLREAYSRVAGDLFKGQLVWALYHQFEITHLSSTPSSDEIGTVQSLYHARLRAPHAQIDTTLQSYSTFISKYFPSKDYEDTMTTIYKLVAPAKATWGIVDTFEVQVQNINDQSMPAEWNSWKAYLSWTARSILSSKKGRSKLNLDVEAVCTLFERAIASCGLPACCVEDLYSIEGRPLLRAELMAAMGKSGDAKEVRKQREEEQLKAEELASLDLWKRYLTFLISAKASSSITSDVCARAGKAIPTSGYLQGKILLVLCQLRRSKSEIDEYFGEALRQVSLTSDLASSSSSSSVVELLIAWLDVQRELAAGSLLMRGEANDFSEAVGLLPQDADSFIEIYSMMTFALNTLDERRIKDEQLRIEALISEWCLQGGQETSALAEQAWDKAIHVQSSNSVAWLQSSRYYRQRRNFAKSRSLLRQGLNRTDIPSDKKVILAEELISLEHIFGAAAGIDWAVERLDAERENVWSEYYASYATEGQNGQQMPSKADGGLRDVIMADDDTTGGKRKAAADEIAIQANAQRLPHSRSDLKRGREGDYKPTRDRENSSILVDRLPIDATQDDIITLFKDCGEIREIAGPKVTSREAQGDYSSASALVEFASRESIPAARSRQFKVVRSSQVDINLGWQCTLYVTNFGQDYDSDEKMRELFEPFGRIFDVRWPSKKFANSRRFCYIQYCNAQYAQTALSLHEKEMKNIVSGETIKMQVFLSDPNRRKIRSDAQSNDRELFISGLPRGVSEGELAILFGDNVEVVRIPKHPDGRNKGIAFVDMKTALDAQVALGYSKEVEGGLRLKGKLITVTVAENVKGSSNNTTSSINEDRKRSSVRVWGLPFDAQEAIIQQLFETQLGPGTVRRVLWTPGEAGKGAAVVEFHNVATAGKASLLPSIQYDGEHLLQLLSLEEKGAVSAPTSSSSTFAAFAPRQAAIRGRGRGRGGLGFIRRDEEPSLLSSSNDRPLRNTNMDIDSTDHLQQAPRKNQDAFRDMLQKP